VIFNLVNVSDPRSIEAIARDVVQQIHAIAPRSI
jgi:hypothetical protein